MGTHTQIKTQTRDAYLGATSGLQHAHHKGVGSQKEQGLAFCSVAAPEVLVLLQGQD